MSDVTPVPPYLQPPHDAHEWACPACHVDTLFYPHANGCPYRFYNHEALVTAAQPPRDVPATPLPPIGRRVRLRE